MRLAAAVSLALLVASALSYAIHVEQQCRGRYEKPWSVSASEISRAILYRVVVSMIGAGIGIIIALAWKPRRTFWWATGLSALAYALLGVSQILKEHTGEGIYFAPSVLWHALSLLSFVLLASIAAAVLSRGPHGTA